MNIVLNGEEINIADSLNVMGLIDLYELPASKVAVERNLEIVPKSAYVTTMLKENDKVEIVHFIGADKLMDDTPLEIAGRKFHSRLIIGTGKYKDYAENAAAAEAAGAEIITVAVRRVNLTDPNKPMLVDFLDQKKYTYLPNTAGCFTGEDAVRTLRLAREAGGWSLVKLEVLGDEKTLYPNMPETLKSRRAFVGGRV